MPAENEVIILHYGVKGMRWGVRKKEELVGDKPTAKEEPPVKRTAKQYQDAAKKLSQERTPLEQQAKNLKENQKKFLAKADIDSSLKDDTPPEASKKGWRPTKNQVLLTALGVAAVGAIAYGAYVSKELPPGARCSPAQFNYSVLRSKTASWTGNKFIDETSFRQKEFTLPAGHVFHRISTQVEGGFRSATYATHSIEDYNRYLTAFRHEKGSAALHHITFKATSDIRVPDLPTRLNAMHEAMRLYNRHGVYTDADVVRAYTRLSGGGWNDSLAEHFFSVLRRDGFGAIIDDMDAGVIGDSPLVVFATDLLSSKNSSPITGSDIKAAAEGLFELANRKRPSSTVAHTQGPKMINEETTDEFLLHYGIKGMRWGHRKAQDSTSAPSSSPAKPVKKTRAEKKLAKKEFYEKKAQNILSKAMADPEILVALKGTDPYPTIVSGREFVQYLSRGGAFNIRYTDIYAEKDPSSGVYVINPNPNQRYKP